MKEFKVLNLKKRLKLVEKYVIFQDQYTKKYNNKKKIENLSKEIN